MKSFQELSKDAMDLLESDFSLVRMLSIKTTNRSGVSLSARSSVTTSGLDTEISLKSSTATEQLGVTLDEFRLGSDGRVNVDASMGLTDSATFKFLAEDGRYEPGKPQNSYGQVGVEVKKTAFKGSFVADLVNGPMLVAQGVLRAQGFSLGGNLHFNTKLDSGYDRSGPTVVDAGLAARYQTQDWAATVSTTNLFRGIHSTYLQNVDGATTVAASVDYSFANNEQTIAVGTQHQLDADSTLKIRVNSRSKLAVSYKQALTPILTGTVSGEIDVTDFGPDNQLVGISLSFEPK